MILTNDRGVPFVKPETQDFATTTEYLRAFWAYRDAIAEAANKAFDASFRKSMRRGSK